MKVLVMGGTQFNGLALVKELSASGHDVTVLNRGRTEAVIPETVHRLVGDRSEPDSIRAALAGTEWDAVHDMTAYHPEDVELMVELLDGRIGHYVFASSTIIYAPADNLPITEDHPEARGKGQIEYGEHKLLCEDIINQANADSGFPATTVPFSMVFGPHNSIYDREQKMFQRLLRGRPVLVPGDGTTLLQVGHVEDQARALEQMQGNPATFGERFNLTGRDFVTRNRYVETLADLVGVQPDVVPIPPDVMDALWTGGLSLDMGRSAVGMDIRSSRPATENPAALVMRRRFQLSQLVQTLAPNLHWWNQPTVFSIDKLSRTIGWDPVHDFSSAAASTYQWYRKAGLDETQEFDWTFEDQLLAHLGVG